MKAAAALRKMILIFAFRSNMICSNGCRWILSLPILRYNSLKIHSTEVLFY